jgi:hypothetical protein
MMIIINNNKNAKMSFSLVYNPRPTRLFFEGLLRLLFFLVVTAV